MMHSYGLEILVALTFIMTITSPLSHILISETVCLISIMSIFSFILVKIFTYAYYENFSKLIKIIIFINYNYIRLSKNAIQNNSFFLCDLFIIFPKADSAAHKA